MNAQLHAVTGADQVPGEISKLSTKRLRPEVIERTVWIIDTSGIVDLLVPPARKGRKGNLRQNVRLFLIGIGLCTRLGHERDCCRTG